MPKLDGEGQLRVALAQRLDRSRVLAGGREPRRKLEQDCPEPACVRERLEEVEEARAELSLELARQLVRIDPPSFTELVEARAQIVRQARDVDRVPGEARKRLDVELEARRRVRQPA